MSLFRRLFLAFIVALIATSSPAPASAGFHHRVQARKSAVFDIATLNLTGWWRAGGTYNAGTGTWSGTASAGTSGSNSISQAGSGKPTAGANLNGLSTVAFASASSQYLDGGANSEATYIQASSWSAWALVNNTSSTGAAGATSAYSNGAVLSDSISYWAGIALSTTNGGVAQSYQWDTGARAVEFALVDATWSLIQAYYDGANLYMRVNSGAWQSIASSSIGSLTSSRLYVGSSYDGVKYFNGAAADIGISKTAFSQVTWDNIKSRINSDYALSL